jgi:hypothetical protein
MACPRIQIFASIGVWGWLCIEIFIMFLSVFLCREYVVCMNGWLCGTGAIGVTPACILYGNVYSAAVCWHGVELCV